MGTPARRMISRVTALSGQRTATVESPPVVRRGTQSRAGSTMVSEIPVVPCSDPHDYEVYHEVEMPAGDFPGDEAITTQAEADCTAQFATFIGLPYDQSSLYFSYLTPTQQSWDDAGDRLIQCIVTDQATQTTGTLAGAAR